MKGDLDAVRGQLDQATTHFRDMEMTWWLEQAEALGTSLAVTQTRAKVGHCVRQA